MELQPQSHIPQNRDVALALASGALPFVSDLAMWWMVPRNLAGNESGPVLLAAYGLPLLGKALFGVGWYAAAVTVTARWWGCACPPLGRLWLRLWLPTLGALLVVQAGLQMSVLPGVLFGLGGVLFLDPVAQAHGRVPAFRAPRDQVGPLLLVWFAWAGWMVMATGGVLLPMFNVPGSSAYTDSLAWFLAAMAWCAVLRRSPSAGA